MDSFQWHVLSKDPLPIVESRVCKAFGYDSIELKPAKTLVHAFLDFLKSDLRFLVIVWPNFHTDPDHSETSNPLPDAVNEIEWDIFVPFAKKEHVKGSGVFADGVIVGVKKVENLYYAVWNGREAVQKSLAILETKHEWKALETSCRIVAPNPLKLQERPFLPSWNDPIRAEFLSEYNVSPVKPCIWCLCWEDHLAGCGMPAHALLLAACMNMAVDDTYEVVIVVPDKKIPKYNLAFGCPVINEVNAINNPMYNNPLAVFEFCWPITEPMLKRVIQVNATRIAWSAGGTMPDALFKFALPFFLHPKFKHRSDVVTTSVMPGRKNYKHHLFLYSPHYQYQASFLRCYYQSPVDIAPYLWSSMFLRTNLTNAPEQIPETEPRTREEYRVCWREERAKFHSLAEKLFPKRRTSAFCAEPNTTYNKTSLIPMMIAEQVDSDLSEMLVVTYMGTWNHYQPSTIRKELKAKFRFMDRTPIGQLGARSAVLISWHNQCALNFLTLDSLFLGLKVVHNSEPWKAAGYYYPEHEIEMGAEQVRRALADGPDTHELPESSIDLLWKYSIFHPDNLAECRRLVEKAVAIRPKVWRADAVYDDIPTSNQTPECPQLPEAPGPESGPTSGDPTPGSSSTP